MKLKHNDWKVLQLLTLAIAVTICRSVLSEELFIQDKSISEQTIEERLKTVRKYLKLNNKVITNKYQINFSSGQKSEDLDRESLLSQWPQWSDWNNAWNNWNDAWNNWDNAWNDWNNAWNDWNNFWNDWKDEWSNWPNY